MSKRIDGKAIAQAMIDSIAKEGRPMKLAALYAGDDPATLSYIKGKSKKAAMAGIELEIVSTPGNVSADDFYSEIEKLNNDRSVTGIIVEKPLPENIDIRKVSSLIDPAKDADCMSPANNGRLITDDFIIAPSTAMAVVNILKAEGIDTAGKDIAVIGRSEIVGKPLAMLLSSKRLCNATPVICHSRTKNIEKKISSADIVITAMGKPHFLKPAHISKGQILIDVGINYIDGKLTGDIDPECFEFCSAYTPVPGGVGPVTVATLFENLLKLSKMDE